MISYRSFLLPQIKYKPGMFLTSRKDGATYIINLTRSNKYLISPGTYFQDIHSQFYTVKEIEEKFKNPRQLPFKYPIGTKLKNNLYIHAYSATEDSDLYYVYKSIGTEEEIFHEWGSEKEKNMERLLL